MRQRQEDGEARCALLLRRVAILACCYSGALLQRRIAHCCSGALRIPPAARYKRSALQEQHVVRAARCKSRAFTSPPLHLPGSAKKRLQVRPELDKLCPLLASRPRATQTFSAARKSSQSYTNFPGGNACKVFRFTASSKLLSCCTYVENCIKIIYTNE